MPDIRIGKIRRCGVKDLDCCRACDSFISQATIEDGLDSNKTKPVCVKRGPCPHDNKIVIEEDMPGVSAVVKEDTYVRAAEGTL